MAETLSPSGIVIPEQKEAISAAGVAEMRTVGATANSAYATLGAEIAGVETALDGKADKGDISGPIPNLTSGDLNGWTASGRWRANPSSVTGAPADTTLLGTFSHENLTSARATQSWVSTDGAWHREKSFGTWSEWSSTNPRDGVVAPDGADWRDYMTPGLYRGLASRTYVSAPFAAESYSVETFRMGLSWTAQQATNQYGVVRFRLHTGSAWRAWETVGGGSGGTGGEARTALEVTGEWTTHAEEETYLRLLAQHREVTLLDLGQSVEGRTIWGVQIGSTVDAYGREKPAVLIECSQHGNEPGTREGAMIFARELAHSTTLALLDLVVVIVPTMNPDRLHESRMNANGVNLNRDWADLSQPEVQAVDALFQQYNVIAGVDGHNGGYSRGVSLREARNPAAHAAVLEQSQRLYDGVFAMFEDEGHEARMYGNPDDPSIPGTFNFEVPERHNVPTLLLELASHWNYDNPDKYAPQPYWQAYMSALCFREVVQIVWRERDAFKAAKEAA